MRRIVIPTALGLLLGLVLAACGGNASSAGDQAATPAVSTDRAQAVSLLAVAQQTADQYVAEIIEFSKKIPGVGNEGLNTTQIKIVRDIVANAVQMGALTVMLVAMYIWQERKRKRTGGRGLQDVVKGYMPGK